MQKNNHTPVAARPSNPSGSKPRGNTARLGRALFLSALAGICLALWMPRAAMAHRVTVFAWVDDGMIHTESNLGGGKKARQAAVEVYDAAGTLLLAGKTDNSGHFSFPTPIQSDMTVVVNAGMGHRGEWRLTRADLAGAAATPPALSARESDPPPANETAVPGGTVEPGTAPLPAERVIEKLIDRKLQPILDKLTRLEQKEHTPGFQDIIGGIGYIAGIAGVVAYMNSRRKRGNHSDQ